MGDSWLVCRNDSLICTSFDSPQRTLFQVFWVQLDRIKRLALVKLATRGAAVNFRQLATDRFALALWAQKQKCGMFKDLLFLIVKKILGFIAFFRFLNFFWIFRIFRFFYFSEFFLFFWIYRIFFYFSNFLIFGDFWNFLGFFWDFLKMCLERLLPTCVSVIVNEND